VKKRIGVWGEKPEGENFPSRKHGRTGSAEIEEVEMQPTGLYYNTTSEISHQLKREN